MVEPDSLRHCCRLHSGGGTERHQLGGTLPSWWEIKDGSDTGCQNNNGALPCGVLCCCLFVCCVGGCFCFCYLCRFSQTVCYSISSPPPCYIRFFACVTGPARDLCMGSCWGGNHKCRGDAQEGRDESWPVDLRNTASLGSCNNTLTTLNKSEIGSRINIVALNGNNFGGCWWSVGTLEK